MRKDREIRSYDYLNHPYEQVRDALAGDVLSVFQAATKSASARAQSVASELRVSIGAIEVATEISISINKIEEQATDSMTPRGIQLDLEWKATKAPRFFPFMRAVLSAYPLTATETQLDFVGRYEPPLGAVGEAINSVLGHRLAEASVHRFVTDVATHLRAALG